MLVKKKFFHVATCNVVTTATNLCIYTLKAVSNSIFEYLTKTHPLGKDLFRSDLESKSLIAIVTIPTVMVMNGLS
jgi:hypothetical protein